MLYCRKCTGPKLNEYHGSSWDGVGMERRRSYGTPHSPPARVKGLNGYIVKGLKMGTVLLEGTALVWDAALATCKGWRVMGRVGLREGVVWDAGLEMVKVGVQG